MGDEWFCKALENQRFANLSFIIYQSSFLQKTFGSEKARKFTDNSRGL